MFADREAFMYDVLLPFLHPLPAAGAEEESLNYSTPSLLDRHSSRRKNNHNMIVARGSSESSKQHIQNQKKNKHPSATLSSEMTARLSQFYETICLEKILLGMQEAGRAVVVPSLTDEEDRWWQ
jgi:hypothetical protein